MNTVQREGACRTHRTVAAIVAACLMALSSIQPTLAAAPSGQTTFAASQPLEATYSLAGNVRAHQAALQAIANAHGGNRAARTAGYDASVAYVVDRLRNAGYLVEIRDFQSPDVANATITLQRLCRRRRPTSRGRTSWPWWG